MEKKKVWFLSEKWFSKINKNYFLLSTTCFLLPKLDLFTLVTSTFYWFFPFARTDAMIWKLEVQSYDVSAC